jgi:hypothetical protein
MVGTVGMLGAVDSASALRCGFASLHPISVKKTIQKFGLRITTVEWRFKSAQGEHDFIKTYPSYIALLNDSVMRKIKLPPRIDPNAIANVLTQKTLEEFNKDKELKSALSKVEKERNSARPFLEFMRFLRKRFEETRAESIQSKAMMFMNSNLSFSFFTDLVMANEIYEGFLDAMERKINLYESVWLQKFAHDPVRFQRKFQEMKESLEPLFDVMEISSFTQRCLNVLILASNCVDVSSIFKLEFIDFKKIDCEQFMQLSNEFKTSLERCTSTIISMEPNSFPKLPRTELNKVFSPALL